MRSKVTVVGAGNVGATTAQRIFDKGYADVVLVDIVDGLPQGKALDMLETGPVVHSDASVIGTNGYEETAGSDIVVITSGIARRPGMSRDDLLLTNMKIVTDVVKQIVDRSPECILLPVTNHWTPWPSALSRSAVSPRTESWVWRVSWTPPGSARSLPRS